MTDYFRLRSRGCAKGGQGRKKTNPEQERGDLRDTNMENEVGAHQLRSRGKGLVVLPGAEKNRKAARLSHLAVAGHREFTKLTEKEHLVGRGRKSSQPSGAETKRTKKGEIGGEAGRREDFVTHIFQRTNRQCVATEKRVEDGWQRKG